MKSEQVNWIVDGEKYALVGLSANLEQDFQQGQVAPALWIVTNPQFHMPLHWREWIGKLRAEEIETVNLFLLSKLKSANPDVLDAENKSLLRAVSQFYFGLMLASPFSTAHKPITLSGSRRNGDVDIRQQGNFEAPKRSILKPEKPLTAGDVEKGVQIATNIKTIEDTVPGRDRWRLSRVLHLYLETRTTLDVLSRIHQFSRCIEGLISPSVGNTKRQFKSRTELFIGAGHHDLIGDIYETRSAVEHLHEYRYLMDFNRDVQLNLLKKEAVVEQIARTTIAKIVSEPEVWKYFLSPTSLEAFWALSDLERRKIWGQYADPLTALEGFNPDFIDDSMLNGNS